VERTKLFLKGDKCLTEKCPVEARSYAPGQHGRARKRILGYGIQLREKQKLKRYYGMSEQQFRLYFKRAEQQKGVTGENLLCMLESRLDNVVFRLGFASSRPQARQWVAHGHVLVNGRKLNIASAQVKVGDVITLRERTRKNQQVLDSVATMGGRGGVPAWLALDADGLKGTVQAMPKRDDIQMPIDEQLIVELYSK